MCLDLELRMAGGKIQVIDDFLSKEDFKLVYDHIMSAEFPWYWNDIVYQEQNVELRNNQENNPINYYQIHLLYRNISNMFNFTNVVMSPSFDQIIKKFDKKLEIKTLDRMKINCYPGQEKLFQHGWHVDLVAGKSINKGALFSLNTCDGYTSFRTGEKIVSVANRMILFDPNEEHSSTNTTNAKRRVNINFNYH